MIFELLASPGSLLGALGSLLGPLGVVLGRSWELLGRSWAILGRSCGILRRSWVALGRSWFALGSSWLDLGRSWAAKRARRAADQGAWRTSAGRSYPPPGEIRDLDPHPSRLHLTLDGRRKRKMGLWNSRNEEECTEDIKDHREDGRVREDERGKRRAVPHAQRPRGPADL